VTNILQVTWKWTGFVGAPGYTNMFFDAGGGTATDANAAVDKSTIFFSGITTLLPSVAKIDVLQDVRLITDFDGELINIFTVSGKPGVTGGNPGNYVGPSGACVDWLTNTVNGRRKMTGRTFIVPCSTAVFDADGTITSAKVLDVATAAESMRTAVGPTFGIWGRPLYSDPPTKPPTIVRNGKWGPAVASRALDKAVVLRSRRD
jgi:hypothetical protein